jgi:hypothetical protein
MMVIGKVPTALSVAGLAMLLLAGCAQVAHGKTAMEMLQEAPKPKFREGHTLLPLSRWGWTMPFDVRVELAEHWGYALEFGGYATPDYVKQLDDPNSIPSKLCALTAADPKRYPLLIALFKDERLDDGLSSAGKVRSTAGRRLSTGER